jgi:peroxiredoxin family protein
MNNFYWTYLKARKNESKRFDLPKQRVSRYFKTEDEAMKYWEKQKDKWVQATLIDCSNSIGHKVFACVDTSQQYRKDYL